jgi:hypothetical protein
VARWESTTAGSSPSWKKVSILWHGRLAKVERKVSTDRPKRFHSFWCETAVTFTANPLQGGF